jgi:hypothetical protein
MDTSDITILATAGEARKVLNAFRDLPIYLPALVRLTPEAAAILATHNYGLTMNALTDMHPETATALRPHEFGLGLRGLTSISRELGDALADHKGAITLDVARLRRIASPALAARLACSENWRLSLESLEYLSPEVAKALFADCPARIHRELRLTGLRFITAETVEALCKHELSCLSLPSLDVLTADVAAALRNGRIDGLSLLGIGSRKTVCTETAQSFLGEVSGTLEVGDVDAVARLFSEDSHPQFLEKLLESLEDLNTDHECDLTDAYVLQLDDLEVLTTTQARLLTSIGSHGRVSLHGVSEVSEEVAASLSECACDIFIDLEILTHADLAAKIATQDRDYDCGEIEVYGCKEISRNAASALVDSGLDLSFPKLTNLTPEVATALAEATGALHLDGVTDLSAEVATRLSEHRNALHLRGLRVIEEDVAEALIQHREALCLDGVIELSHEAAMAFARRSVDSEPLSFAKLRSTSRAAWAALRKCPSIALKSDTN